VGSGEEQAVQTETHLIKLNGMPVFTMTVTRHPWHSVQALAREVMLGGSPDAVIGVTWLAKAAQA